MAGPVLPPVLLPVLLPMVLVLALCWPMGIITQTYDGHRLPSGCVGLGASSLKLMMVMGSSKAGPELAQDLHGVQHAEQHASSMRSSVQVGMGLAWGATRGATRGNPEWTRVCTEVGPYRATREPPESHQRATIEPL